MLAAEGLGDADLVGSLVVSGNVVHCAAGPVELTDIEARIIGLLAERAGAVVSKAELLDAVWGDSERDPHVVEVAVGRLRRRLGADGSAVAMVPRRGYALR